jgi:hypothetical protein
VEAVISTAILLIVTIIAASVFTAAALSELSTFENTFKEVGSRNQEILESSITIIGETNESVPPYGYRIIVWVKNVGGTSFEVGGSSNNAERSWDVFVTFPNGTYSLSPYDATGQCPTIAECWGFDVSLMNAGGTGTWEPGETIQLTIYAGGWVAPATTPIPPGEYQVSVSLPNGVTAQDTFSF